MKKILLIIPVLLFFVYNNLVSFSVFAISGGVERPGIETDAPEVDPDKYITLEELFADNRFKDAAKRRYYFYFTYDQKHSSMDIWYNRSCVLTTNSDALTVTEEDGIYTVSSTDSSTFYFNHYQKRDGSFNGLNYSNSSTFTGFIYNSNLNTLTLINPYGSYPDDNTVIDSVQTNMFKNSDDGALTVTVDPELKGTVSLDSGNVSYNSIDVTIHNNTNYAYQYSIFVVKDGDTISFDNLVDGEITSDTNVTLSGKSYSGNAQYVYVTDEWVQTYVNNDVAVVNAPSTWHYIYPGGNQIAHISTRCIKLLPNVDYRFLVYACRIDSEHVISYVGDPAFDVSHRPFEAFNAFFRVASATPFDASNPESGIGGTLTFDPDSNVNTFFDKVNGYEDSNGNVIVSGKRFDELHSIGGSSSSSGAGTYNTLVVNSRSFFSFLRTVLGYFPATVLTVLNLGLWSILLLAIIRRLH